MKMTAEIEGGHYARKQILSRARLIAWSHRRRFEIGLRLADECAGRRVLDYGCGDGTFLALLMSGGSPPALALGVEVDARSVLSCRTRLRQPGRLDFITAEEFRLSDGGGRYDAVFCMEVLEHVVNVRPLLDTFARALAPGGRLFISVPVETGLPLAVKQVARQVAAWRGLGDYPGVTPYTWREYCASLWAGCEPHITRPTHTGADGNLHHDHKGFNWMKLREDLSALFALERTISSPITWLPPHLASQVWFVARKRQR
jgi:SAM-dependent methyltransferase